MSFLKTLACVVVILLLAAAIFGVVGGVIGFALTTVIAGFTGIFEGLQPAYGTAILGAWVGILFAVWGMLTDWKSFVDDVVRNAPFSRAIDG